MLGLAQNSHRRTSVRVCSGTDPVLENSVHKPVVLSVQYLGIREVCSTDRLLGGTG